MALSFSANQQFPCAPVYIVELDCHNLERALAKAGHQQQHCVVAGSTPRIGPHRCQNGLHLVGRQMTWKPCAQGLCARGTHSDRFVVVRPCANRYWKKLRKCVAGVLSRNGRLRAEILYECHDIPGVQRQ